MAKYYVVDPKGISYDELWDKVSPILRGRVKLTESERGLNEICESPVNPKVYTEHEYLVLPENSGVVSEGGKQYLHCMNCGHWSHL